jgi:rSAM/selenodomain-associated transferase 1
MKNKNALIIFAKNPVHGKVKTRLAKHIGNDKAMNLYLKLLYNTYLKTKDMNCDKYLFLSDRKEIDLFGNNFKQIVQNGNDIGERMKNAFDEVFKSGHSKIILIGTDIPELDEEILNTAFDKLSESDIVLGPAADGGYYLIGMKNFSGYVFDNIKWSTDKVLSKTIENINERKESFQSVKKTE